MKTLIISENRKTGVDWLAAKVAAGDINNILQRTQTKIVTEADTYLVVSKLEHIDRVNSNDHAVIVGNVAAGLIDSIVRTYRTHRYNIEIVQDGGAVLSAVELKRRQLQIQMADLDTEERVETFFRELAIPGVTFRPAKINTNAASRSFTVELVGRFD